MSILNKPDEHIFASAARRGEVADFPDLPRGWGISFDQTAGIPPMEWFNALFKRGDEKVLYMMQRGLPEWSATLDYPSGAYVQYDGKSYRSLRANRNKKPNISGSADWVRWGFSLTEIARATLTQAGIVQLTNDTGLDSETLALTAKAGKKLAQQIAQNQQRITELGNQKLDKTVISDAVNSDSRTQVASSKAVKTANDNAEGRVLKSGDTMTGVLEINTGASFVRGKKDGRDNWYAGKGSSNSDEITLHSYAYDYGIKLQADRVQLGKQPYVNTHRVFHEGFFPLFELLVGIPFPYPLAEVPEDCLALNGQRFDKRRYPVLARKYPSGVLPDLRGEFIRGWDNGRGVDIGRQLGEGQKGSLVAIDVSPSLGDTSVQGLSIKKGSSINTPLDAAQEAGLDPTSQSDMANFFQAWISRPERQLAQDAISNSSGNVRSGHINGFTRPRNVAFHYICLAG